MTENLLQAHAQWMKRPADERFASLDELLAFARDRKAKSQETVQSLKTLKIDYDDVGELTLNENGSRAYFSNWAFGQACRIIGAPASYLRTLPVSMTKGCLQYGIEHSDERALLLTRSQNIDREGSARHRYVSAFTGPNYGRIWDADVVECLADAVRGSGWRVPSARSNNQSSSSGLYASDHDMFAFFVSDENPVWIGDTKLGKGFFCWNSETGASTFGLTTFLWNYICSNHIVWGAEEVNEIKIIHRINAPEKFYDEALPYLDKFVDDRHLDVKIRDQVERAMASQIGSSLDDIQTWFKERPFTKREIEGAWRASMDQSADPKTLWGIVQGLTSYSQDYDFADRRVDLDRRAGQLLNELA